MKKNLAEQHKANIRASFLAAAQDLFAAHGVNGVTMRQIAQAVGYSQTTAYGYFENKEEILAEVQAAALNRFCERIEATAKKRSARARARAVGEAYLQFATEEPDSYRLIYTTPFQADKFPSVSKAVERANRCMTSYVNELIDEGILAGDAEELGQMFWAAAHGVVMLQFAGHIPDMKRRDYLHKQMTRLILKGTGPKATVADAPEPND